MIDWYDLNARHEAAALWFGALFICFLVASRDVRQSVLGLLKILGHRPILPYLMGLMLVVVAMASIAVYVGRIAGLWETLPVVTVSVWTVSSGVGLLMRFPNFLKKDGEFKRASAVLTPAAIIAALTNVAILPFWWEVALLPLLGILSILFAFYDSKDRGHRVHGFVKAALVSYTLVIVSLSIKSIVQDPGTWKGLAQAVSMPVWLTLGTLPYIRFLILFGQWRFRFRCPSMTVSSTDYGKDWPLTVDSAKLCCKRGAVWVEVDGRKYGLHGFADALLPKWGHTCSDLSEIWKDDPHLRGAKVNTYRLLKDGLALEDR